MLKGSEGHVAVDVREPHWLRPLRAEPPAWVAKLTGTQPEQWLHAVEVIPDAEALSAPALQAAVAQAYGRLADRLARAGRHPVRFWNFIPGIHAELDAGLDRYMAFNAGRFAAFRQWFGSAPAFSQSMPTASAVGVVHGPLVMHVLGCAEPGSPIENPRQIPAYSYSRRYGPFPPCFARATRVPAIEGSAPASGRLLVGGTASIVGEDSWHERNGRQQALETFDNLNRLLTCAFEASGIAERPSDPLRAFTDLRVYIVRQEDADPLREQVTARVPHLTVEYAQADLCRRELLIEIEGRASLIPVSYE